jgi:protein arginine kinase activator
MSVKPPHDANRENTSDTPERPLECSECRRPMRVIYTEVTGNICNTLGMCNECPELQRRLKGSKEISLPNLQPEGGMALACGNCGTTLESIRIGMLLGCSRCYEVFEHVLVDELVRTHALPSRIHDGKRSQILHIGRMPGTGKEQTPSLRLLALNEALHETLAQEDYEQAALLRDQIRALTEKKESSHEQP